VRKFFKSGFTVVVLAVGLAAHVVAGPFEPKCDPKDDPFDCEIRLDEERDSPTNGRGDYATAMRLLRPLADQGVAKGQSNLGDMYFWGQGVPQNYATALGWYRKAADQGDAKAQFQLGLMHQLGQGVPQDYPAAMGWFQKVADQGFADAQSQLGVMFANGRGVPQDYVNAHTLSPPTCCPSCARYRRPV
jgi:hypothetical protein